MEPVRPGGPRASRGRKKNRPCRPHVRVHLLSPPAHHFILFLLQEGFDALDPFIPILVSNYSPKEFESCIQYYLENSWLQHEKGRLIFRSFMFRVPLSQSHDLFFPRQQPATCISLFPFILTPLWLAAGCGEGWGRGS